ncbi:MAG: hypothetical protein NZ703_04660 [Gemmataceae bacterium]|nr:hypothetical protein [Gemmataceae bacterium]
MSAPDVRITSVTDPAAAVPPWQEIAPGRFMPRRIRGSWRGRVLG